MKKFLLLLFLFAFGLLKNCFPQGAPPWERPLMICYSADGINFTSPVIYQDSSGVPSVVKDSTGRLVAAFQWFPAPLYSLHWDSVAVKFSLDSGMTWSFPQSITVQNLPANFQRPFDPTVVALPGGQIRIYFSSGPPGTNTIATYSAIGTDGINYVFEPGIRFSQSGRNVIDPAVTIFGDTFQYTAPKGAPQDGAFHAKSGDGLNFIQLADIVSDSSHQWTGNLMVDSLAMKFYGTGARGATIWSRSTPNGSAWGPYAATNIAGGDPAIVKPSHAHYVMIFTGQPSPTPVVEIGDPEHLIVYPNPAKDYLTISVSPKSMNVQMKIFDIMGRQLADKKYKTDPGETEQKINLDVSEFSNGFYFLMLKDDDKTITQKFSVVK